MTERVVNKELRSPEPETFRFRGMSTDSSVPDRVATSVVVGFDGSDAAERALERAADLAGTDGRVVVVTARPTGAQSPLTAEPILDAPSPSEQRYLLQRGRALLEGRGAEASFIAMDDDPAEALLRVARSESATLIVVGQTGSGYVTRALLGSTAENVLRHTPCDVLVVV
jgi:nucleotide-binding universal stress UspA family protein